MTGAAKVTGKIVGRYGDDAVKVTGKIAKHGSDNVAEHVIVNYGDDAAKAVVKGGERAALHTAPKIARAVDVAVDAARIESVSMKPAVEAIHRAPIVKPAHFLAGGGGVATVVAAQNLTAGEREKDRALADSTRKTLADHPEMLHEVVRVERETGLWNRIGVGAGRGMEWALPILAAGGSAALVVLAIGWNRRKRKNVAVDATSGKAAA